MKRHLRACIFASPPPPIGGVTSIVGMLMHSFASFDSLGFYSPLPKKSSCLNVLRPIHNSFLLLRAISNVQCGGHVLFFSSSGYSFFEKLVWALLVRSFNCQPVIVMVDGNFPAFWTRLPLILKYIVSILFSQTQPILGTQSSRWSSYFSSIYPGVDCRIVGATVHPDFFAANPWNDCSSSPVILYVGWITKSKGVADLIHAYSQIASIYPTSRLRLVGPYFNGLQEWQDLASSLGILHQIEFVGPVSDRQQLIAELLDSSLFVLPSHAEGLPVALLEAMALGVPCIATDVGAVTDLLENDYAGTLVPPHQPSKLALAMDNLLFDSNRRLTLSSNALVRVRSNYGTADFILSYRQILHI